MDAGGEPFLPFFLSRFVLGVGTAAGDAGSDAAGVAAATLPLCFVCTAEGAAAFSADNMDVLSDGCNLVRNMLFAVTGEGGIGCLRHVGEAIGALLAAAL